MDELLFSRREAIGRRQRREQDKEFIALANTMFDVEKRFYEDLFEEDYSYAETYKYYLDQYNENLEYLIETKKPRWYGISRLYFSQRFAPIEQGENDAISRMIPFRQCVAILRDRTCGICEISNK
ncbi:MAG: hypothetical protein ACOYMF_06120 [Bacteroidales bacterium]